MKKVVIIGCGFAGFNAAAQFCGRQDEFEVTAIDRKEYLDFLPLLPDILGRGIAPGHLRFSLKAASLRLGFRFVNAQVQSVDFNARKVFTAGAEFPYDYLLLASGSETNFYGNSHAQRFAYKLDDVADAVNIRTALGQKGIDCCVIAGGGYTGIEIAANLRKYFNRRGLDKKVVIFEKSPSILGPLPQWMKEYAGANLKSLNIGIVTSATIEQIEENRVKAGGEVFENAILIWAAGVRVADLAAAAGVERSPQGRYRVDEYLKIGDNCFAAGDASYFAGKNGPLRMAVQFAIVQGVLAGANIIRSSRGSKLESYQPVDFGYLVPMANNRSCGEVFGLALRGRTATILHYLMCFYRSFGWDNRIGIIRDLILPRR